MTQTSCVLMPIGLRVGTVNQAEAAMENQPRIPGAHATTTAHYQQLLAPLYTWMQGGWPSALRVARETLRQLEVPQTGIGRSALDLGCANGAHATALVELGYSVTGVDSSATLLDELRSHAPDASVVCDDICNAVRAKDRGYDLVLCLGDTLPYLASLVVVEEFLSDCAALVNRGGMFALSFRDYSISHVPGDSAVVFVRNDAQRLLTCCITYHESSVRVTDIVHEAVGDSWTGRASHCDKLRLNPAHIASHLRRDGLAVQLGSLTGGMVSIVACR
jgi:2-polyprenyl-3-methyl-5-hydroxy-6-metoxy-1,4-benzoquinol methylase